jgi:hypothetical protein
VLHGEELFETTSLSPVEVWTGRRRFEVLEERGGREEDGSDEIRQLSAFVPTPSA